MALNICFYLVPTSIFKCYEIIICFDVGHDEIVLWGRHALPVTVPQYFQHIYESSYRSSAIFYQPGGNE